jgi:hypothetical protein
MKHAQAGDPLQRFDLLTLVLIDMVGVGILIL